MNPAEIAVIAQLAEQMLPLAANLINSLRNAGANVKTVEELLAEASTNDDGIIATAQKELNPPTA